MTGGMERMPDAALSRKLGHYQKMAAVWRLVGLAGAVGGVLTLVLETDYGFAAVAGSVDLRDLDAARESYRRSLRELAGVLDLLLENTALFAAGTER